MIRSATSKLLLRSTPKPTGGGINGTTSTITRTLVVVPSQKRALDESQIQTIGSRTASSSSAATVRVSSSSKPTTSSPTPGSSGDKGGGGGGGILLPALGLVGAAAGGAYYMDLIPPEYLTPVQDMLGTQTKPNTKDHTPTPPPKKAAPTNSTSVPKPPSTDNQPAPTTAPTPSIHRVTQIIAPPKDTTRTIAPPPPVQHAEDAHRVPVPGFPRSSTTDEDTTPTDANPSPSVEVPSSSSSSSSSRATAAELELAPVTRSWDRLVSADLPTATASSPKPNVEALYKDLDGLSPSELKARVVGLVTEMGERTKWEAVRLREFLGRMEKEAEERHISSLQTQRLEFQSILAQRLRDQETRLHNETTTLLQSKEDAVQNLLQQATDAQEAAHKLAADSAEDVLRKQVYARAEAEYGTKLAEEKAVFAKELEEKTMVLEQLVKRLEENDEALRLSRRYEDGSMTAHRISAAGLALVERLEGGGRVGGEVEVLRTEVGEGRNGPIEAALGKIPKEVVPTLAELQEGFEAVHEVGRQAAHVPVGRSGLEGQIAGIIFSKLASQPSPDTPPPSKSNETGFDYASTADHILAVARREVRQGRLEEAVGKLEELEGQAAFVVRDWKKSALERVAVDKALKIIKLECALLNKNMAG